MSEPARSTDVVSDELIEFAKDVIRQSWDGSLDEPYVQELGVKLGLLKRVVFDPAIHSDVNAYAEAGDTWYIFDGPLLAAPAHPLPQSSLAAEKQRADSVLNEFLRADDARIKVEQRVAALEGALTPFAAVLDNFDPSDEDDETPGTLVVGSVTDYSLTLGDFRRAAELGMPK